MARQQFHRRSRARHWIDRILVLGAALCALQSIAPAYYHWVFYLSGDGNFIPIREKFDLSKSNTIPYFISQEGPSQMVVGDSFPALISQIRRAAETWNQVPTAAIELEFGGMGEISIQRAETGSDTSSQPEFGSGVQVGLEQNAPGIDVVFDDEMPPGILAQSWPETLQDLTSLAPPPPADGEPAPDPSEIFAPILRSRLQLRSNLADSNQPSYSDQFFMTMVHEFGHTLGLQHSMASATMSTSITRATGKGHPLAADDIAGLSLLYPTPEFLATTGTISGQVTTAGEGASLASVVALSTNGTVINTLAHPDGTYKIEGLPPGDYYVYAHPLPAAVGGELNPAGITPPADLTGEYIPAKLNFETKFYPGTRNWQDADVISVAAGTPVEAVDFDLEPRDTTAMYSVRTYGYFGTNSKQLNDRPDDGSRGVLYTHAPMMRSGVEDVLVVSGPGIATNDGMTPGLQVSEIGSAGGVESDSLRFWQQGFVLMKVSPPVPDTATTVDENGNSVPAPLTPARPVALAFTTDNDLYVLPAAFSVADDTYPDISAVWHEFDPQGNEYAYTKGVHLDRMSDILFDGVPAMETKYANGTLVSKAPPASDRHQATLFVLDAAGHSSGELYEGRIPTRFGYLDPNIPLISTRPGDVIAGTDSAIEVTGSLTNFLDGLTSFGFGTSDITVRQVWIQNRSHAWLNIAVSPTAQTGKATITAASGLEIVNLDTIIQVHAPSDQQVSLHTPIVNHLTGLKGVPPNGTARIPASGITPENFGDGAGWVLKIDGSRAAITLADDGSLLATVPGNVHYGPVLVQLTQPNGDTTPSVLVQVDDQPPTILSIADSSVGSSSGAVAYTAGDTVQLVVSGLAPLFAALPQDVEVYIGGVPHVPTKVEWAGGFGDIRLTLILADSVPAGDQDVAVREKTRQSAPVKITVAAPPSTDTSASSSTSSSQ